MEFNPYPEKLESIAKMPAPKNSKEVKQFLGLVGYYRKLSQDLWSFQEC